MPPKHKRGVNRRVFKLDKAASQNSWPRISRQQSTKILGDLAQYTTQFTEDALTKEHHGVVPGHTHFQDNVQIHCHTSHLLNSCQIREPPSQMPIEVADSSRKRRRFRKHMRTPRPDANSLSGFKAITKTTHVPICNNALDLKHTQTPGRSSTAVVCVPGRVPGLSPNLIVVGVRDVTKHLVRNSLELVMIGEDIRSVMVQHIPTLCGRQKVRCVSLAAPSSDIAGILRVTRATVIGVLRRAASSRPVVSSTLLSPYTTTAKDEIYSSQQLNSWLYKALDQHAAQLSTSL